METTGCVALHCTVMYYVEQEVLQKYINLLQTLVSNNEMCDSTDDHPAATVSSACCCHMEILSPCTRRPLKIQESCRGDRI